MNTLGLLQSKESTLQETQRIHDSMNIPKIEFIAYHHIIIGFLINVQVQGHHPHQWAPFQVTG